MTWQEHLRLAVNPPDEAMTIERAVHLMIEKVWQSKTDAPFPGAVILRPKPRKLLKKMVDSAKIETVETGVTSTDSDLTLSTLLEVNMATTKPTKLIPPNQTAYPKECLVGRVFHRLTVLAFAGRDDHREPYWECECNCGTRITTRGSRLKGKVTTGCGRHHDKSRRNFYRKQTEHNAFMSARQRCNDKGCPQYSNYGGRGIQFRFNSFEQFLAELGRKPTPAHSLDRIDVNGHYEPGNVRWATPIQQARNTRTNRHVTIHGKTRLACEWAAIIGMAQQPFTQRIERGMCDDCLVKPPDSTVRCTHKTEGLIGRFLTAFGETHALVEWSKITGLMARTIAARLRLGWTIEDALSRPVQFRRHRHDRR